MDETYNTEMFFKAVPPGTVLMVDDNATNLQVLNAALDGAGFRLLAAKSGESALRIAEANPPAVVLLDINMPEMDGFEVCRRLKNDPMTRDARVVFLSSRGELEDKVAGLELGAIDYIEKPFNAGELLARVKGHVENYRQQQALKQQNRQLKKLASGSHRALESPEVLKLIGEGETDRVEFKSTLRLNLHTKKNGKEIENAVLKTIAAFLNSSGGTLLIGVADDGNVLGIGTDQFPNDDRFLLHLKNLVRDHIGIQFVRLLDIALHDLDGRKVCAVQCLPSNEPVFFHRDKEEFFYVRLGPSTQALSPSQLLEYLKTRGE